MCSHLCHTSASSVPVSLYGFPILSFSSHPPSFQLILAATERFNKKPKQGVSFLMEQGVLASPMDAGQVADFLLENPGLRKDKIGDYIGDRKNTEILEAFVR